MDNTHGWIHSIQVSIWNFKGRMKGRVAPASQTAYKLNDSLVPFGVFDWSPSCRGHLDRWNSADCTTTHRHVMRMPTPWFLIRVNWPYDRVVSLYIWSARMRIRATDHRTMTLWWLCGAVFGYSWILIRWLLFVCCRSCCCCAMCGYHVSHARTRTFFKSTHTIL